LRNKKVSILKTINFRPYICCPAYLTHIMLILIHSLISPMQTVQTLIRGILQEFAIDILIMFTCESFLS